MPSSDFQQPNFAPTLSTCCISVHHLAVAQKSGTEMAPGKWNQQLKPAVCPSSLIFSHTLPLPPFPFYSQIPSHLAPCPLSDPLPTAWNCPTSVFAIHKRLKSIREKELRPVIPPSKGEKEFVQLPSQPTPANPITLNQPKNLRVEPEGETTSWTALRSAATSSTFSGFNGNYHQTLKS